MNLEPFEKIINEAWENKNQINKNSDKIYWMLSRRQLIY